MNQAVLFPNSRKNMFPQKLRSKQRDMWSCKASGGQWLRDGVPAGRGDKAGLRVPWESLKLLLLLVHICYQKEVQERPEGWAAVTWSPLMCSKVGLKEQEVL